MLTACFAKHKIANLFAKFFLSKVFERGIDIFRDTATMWTKV